ncbi:hypothetical protein LG329_18285 [Virgibacillus necropolis]|uniref:hypothetical protein n=1 Tax=Virgibacillus necropolis TaxID=163877 RepID=UPI00384BB0B0
MTSEEKTSKPERSIRAIAPELYANIISELENAHIHPYDIQANAVKEDGGYKLIIRFGEDFAHTESEFFSFQSIERMDTDLTEFVKKIGEACKQVMIQDYYKMMKM